MSVSPFEISHCLRIALIVDRFAVPLALAFHEGNAFAFHSTSDDDGRQLHTLLGGGERCIETDKIVSVRLDDAPAESAKFLADTAERHDLIDPAVELHSIAIYDRDQVVEPELRGGHGGFPNLALLKLTISEQHVGPKVQVIQPGRQ